MKIRGRLAKRYGDLLTCSKRRAINVEIAHSFDNDLGIMAIRRFLAILGVVKVTWSDNGTNLHGANRDLSKALEQLEIEALVEDMANSDIE